MDPMRSPYDFGTKYGRKIDQNVPICFFQRNHLKTRSETRFHQNRQYKTDFRLKKLKNGQDLKNLLPLKVGSTVNCFSLWLASFSMEID